MAFDPLKPYNGLPLLPPSEKIETIPVLKKALSAARAMAELKGIGETIPSQAILLTTITLQEARASSEIENIVTTSDALFRAYASEGQTDPMTKEVLRYREAMWEGYNALRKRPFLTTEMFIRIVQTIRENNAGIRNVPGTKIANPSTGKIIYTPPEGESIIRDKLSNLQEYIHADDGIDPLVKMAVIHYQFEAIHPFTDGNGRTGRILNILYLVHKGVLELPVLYLSRHMIENRTDYYRRLRSVTEKGAWEPWILYMLEAVEKTAHQTRQMILEIRSLLDETLAYSKANLPARVYSKELIELLFRQPYTKVKFLVDEGLAERKTAASYLKAFEKIGILESRKVGKENLYLNKKLYKLLSGPPG